MTIKIRNNNDGMAKTQITKKLFFRKMKRILHIITTKISNYVCMYNAKITKCFTKTENM